MRTKHSFSFILLFCFGLTTSVIAQSNLRRQADQLFYKFAYAKAIPAYEKLALKDNHSHHAWQRLAECHLMLRDFEKALPYFDRFINEEDLEPDYYFKYGMALKSAGKEKEALKWFKRYKKLTKNDSRIKRYLKEGNYASVLFNSRESYEIEPVHFNTEYGEFGAISHNGKLYFSSSRIDEKENNLYDWNNEAWLDIYYIEEGIDSVPPRKLKGDINSKYHESSLVFSTNHKNDTVIYFTRNNYFNKKEGFHTKKEDNKVESTSNLKIYRAEHIDGEWKVTRNMLKNADHYSSGHPSVNSARTYIYFASDKPGGFGGTDIYYAKIHARGGIGEPINAGPVVNTAGNEMFPYVNNEGQLFFSSDGHPGFGQLDVFATVADSIGAFKDVINLGKPINSEKDDFGYFAYDNGIDGYISSNRDGGAGGDDIYEFRFYPSLRVEGKVTDGINLKPLNNVKISLYDQKTSELVAETLTDADGSYEIFIDRKRNYMIEASRKTHPKKNIYFNTFTTPRAERVLVQDITLDPILDVKVLAGLNKIYFDFNKHNIRPDAAEELDKVVKLMTKTYPDMIIKLESHTDPVGSHAYNDSLSERRAKSTYEYLIANGVPRHHILSYKGYGERQLVNDCKGKEDCTPEELELNRRTEFPIIQIKGKPLAKSN
ncbi:OmpA family protein [Allomuricauda sp. SCSIO 65647]|uniref:OmpA family protein n=1 Tax=Allomuricauda sp. SCSIO 65647 TaxID=2908843 RepID=UPI001F3C0871|nr:OmpA family protein [Muricauda sp. SCSIO 65647]UJH68137.1 OmpA family protein [Muricauda sp. SCSIO 65647]